MAFRHFSYEVTKPPRWDMFTAGLAIDFIGLVMMIVIAPHLSYPVLIDRIDTTKSVVLIAPRLTPVPQVPSPPLVPPAPKILAKLEPPKQIEPRKVPEPPKIDPPKALPRSYPQPTLAPTVPVTPPRPSHPVEKKMNVFGAAGSETASVHRRPSEVQTGGFGDPNGVPGTGDPKRKAIAIARVGSFDLPQGPGHGNGTGGTHGTSGTIHSAGFSDGVASPGPHGPGKGGTVTSAGFGDVVAATAGSSPRQKENQPELQPVEILFKPRPAYTTEARRAGIQGEVLLDVIFEASGELRVKRVVRGLGYGLDESALAAARRIRFRPARRDGQPYDSAALVHIVFELAD